MAHRPICNAATTNHRLLTRPSQRCGKSSKPTPTRIEANSNNVVLVADSTWLAIKLR